MTEWARDKHKLRPGTEKLWHVYLTWRGTLHIDLVGGLALRTLRAGRSSLGEYLFPPILHNNACISGIIVVVFSVWSWNHILPSSLHCTARFPFLFFSKLKACVDAVLGPCSFPRSFSFSTASCRRKAQPRIVDSAFKPAWTDGWTWTAPRHVGRKLSRPASQGNGPEGLASSITPNLEKDLRPVAAERCVLVLARATGEIKRGAMNHGKEFSKKNSARVTLRYLELLCFVREWIVPVCNVY